MTRVAIHGAAGRMGRHLIAACLDAPHLELTAALVRPGDDRIGTDAGTLAGREACGVSLTDTARADEFDVAVDFSQPDGALDLLEVCRAAGTPMVIGTTGFSAAQRARVGGAAQEIPLVLAPNTGIGVNVVIGLVEQAARALGEEFDVEVLEAHHRHKVDAPSGTALRLGEAAARALGRDLASCGVYSREGHTGARQPGTIGFATVRAGEIVGEHTVLFAGSGERVEITHRAASRGVFASGAMRAAAWIVAQPAGLYDMQDVLGLAAA
jgi:4-hydroxy-tetrahydrodipicolinate reductase